MTMFVLVRGQIVKRGMPPGRVVQQVIHSKIAARASARVAKSRPSSSSHAKVALKLSLTALSKQSPTDPIDRTMPSSAHRSVNAIEVYWLP